MVHGQHLSAWWAAELLSGRDLAEVAHSAACNVCCEPCAWSTHNVSPSGRSTRTLAVRAGVPCVRLAVAVCHWRAAYPAALSVCIADRGRNLGARTEASCCDGDGCARALRECCRRAALCSRLPRVLQYCCEAAK